MAQQDKDKTRARESVGIIKGMVAGKRGGVSFF